jgi:hypothetical protein
VSSSQNEYGAASDDGGWSKNWVKFQVSQEMTVFVADGVGLVNDSFRTAGWETMLQ